MPSALKYPPRAGAPTIAYTLQYDQGEASPRVAETPTLGFPWELSQITFTSSRDTTVTIHFALLVATNPFLGGDARDGILLHSMGGDHLPTDRRNMNYYCTAPLTLRPRIRVPYAGARLRLVQDQAVGAVGLKALVIITPLD
jgi:hypothetical protein